MRAGGEGEGVHARRKVVSIKTCSSKDDLLRGSDAVAVPWINGTRIEVVARRSDNVGVIFM